MLFSFHGCQFSAYWVCTQIFIGSFVNNMSSNKSVLSSHRPNYFSLCGSVDCCVLFVFFKSRFYFVLSDFIQLSLQKNCEGSASNKAALVSHCQTLTIHHWVVHLMLCAFCFCICYQSCFHLLLSVFQQVEFAHKFLKAMRPTKLLSYPVAWHTPHFFVCFLIFFVVNLVFMKYHHLWFFCKKLNFDNSKNIQEVTI